MGIKIKHNFYRLPTKHSIILLNYPSDIFEYFLNGVIPVKSCLVISHTSKVYMNFIGQNEPIFVNLKSKGNFSFVEKQIKDKIKKYFVMSYVEKDKKIGKIGKIRSGMFRIANKHGIPITPIFIGRINSTNALPIIVGRTRKVRHVKKSIKNVRNFYLKNIQKYYA